VGARPEATAAHVLFCRVWLGALIGAAVTGAGFRRQPGVPARLRLDRGYPRGVPMSGRAIGRPPAEAEGSAVGWKSTGPLVLWLVGLDRGPEGDCLGNRAARATVRWVGTRHSVTVSPWRWATLHWPDSRRYTWVARSVYVRG
jgi:hypothetical protein